MKVHLSSALDINIIGCRASAATKDDRIHTFKITSASGRVFWLQAENGIMMSEWIDTINALAKDFRALLSTSSTSHDMHKFVYFEQDRDSSGSEGDDESESSTRPLPDEDTASINGHASKSQFLWGSATMLVTKDNSTFVK